MGGRGEAKTREVWEIGGGACRSGSLCACACLCLLERKEELGKKRGGGVSAEGISWSVNLEERRDGLTIDERELTVDSAPRSHVGHGGEATGPN